MQNGDKPVCLRWNKSTGTEDTTIQLVSTCVTSTLRVSIKAPDHLPKLGPANSVPATLGALIIRTRFWGPIIL